MRVLYGEWIKMRRTISLWLVLLAPILFSLFMVWYFLGRPVTANLPIIIYEAFYQVWAAMVVPIGAGLLPGLMTQQEALAGDFRGLLGSITSRRSLYLYKLVMLTLLTAASTALAVVTLIFGLNFVGIPIPLLPFISGAVIVELATIPLLALHLWIGFAWGLGPSIGVGGAGMLFGALSFTTLGDHYWQYIPWGWTSKFSMVPGTYYFYQLITPVSKVALLATTFLFAVVMGGLLWFDQWEGRENPD